MKCIYRFPVKGCFRPEAGAFFTVAGWSVRFETDASGYASHLLYTLSSNPENAPTLRNPSESSMGRITVPTPEFETVRRHVQVLENALSFFGVFAIPTDEWRIEWVPENEHEREALSMNTFACAPDVSCPDDAPFVPVDLVSRCVSNTEALRGIDSLLCFNRHGREDLRQERFIDAFYDFFFVLESRFGGGKFHRRQLEGEFRKHSDLIAAVAATQAQRSDWYDGSSRSRPYAQKASVDILDHLIAVRGELHHHSARKRGIWHPGEQSAFRADAMFLSRTVQKVCLELLTHTLGIS